MLQRGPPNIWMETHSILTVSNSIPSQRVEEKRNGEQTKGLRRSNNQFNNAGLG